ncbi:transporter substrate-binding domain-containing protein [Candidatus Woesearchaeota archaeon]|nr:transporter substrate-binding domain-containing protein [Candidatus Woesearchaeota archaeon]
MGKKKTNGSIFLVLILTLIIVAACTKKTEVQQKNDNQITDNSLINVKKRGKLIIGAIPDYPPMEYIDENGDHVGYDIDVVKEIASQLGVDSEIKQIMWGDLFNAVKSGEVDLIISSITITQERQQEMLFSVPYFDAGQTIVVQKNTKDISSPGDLKGKKIGVNAGTTCEKIALEYANNEDVIGYPGYDPIINDLKNNEIDAMVTDLIGASNYVKNNPDLKLVGEPFTQEFYGIATKLGNNALMEEIDRILRNMKRSGKLKEIKNKWLK